MNYEPTKNEVDFTRCLLGNHFWTDVLIAEALKQTKIFHYLTVVKLLKKSGGEDWQIPEFDEINNLLNKILDKKEKTKEPILDKKGQ